ncbi:MAG: AsmA-like C-terminal region-containing protein [Candidatus Gastranaerophilaceae bacterium]
MKKRLKVLIGIFITVCVYALYYWGLPAILNMPNVCPLITQYIQKEYGLNLKLSNLKIKMGLTPTLWIKADNIKLLNDNLSTAFSVDKPIIEISLPPLILGKVHLNYFSSTNLFADINFDKELNFSLGQFLIIKNSNSVININDSKLLAENFLINLTDKSKNKKVLLRGNFFNINRFNQKKYINADADLNILTDSNNAHFNCSIDSKLPFNKHLDDYPPEISAAITNLDLSEFSDIVTTLSKNKIKNIEGLINFDFHSAQEISKQKQYFANLIIKNIIFNSDYVNKTFLYPHSIQLKSTYLLSGNHLNIPNIDFMTPKFSAKISGSIDKISSKKPIPDLQVKMFNAKAKDLLEIIPYSYTLDNLTDINFSVAKDANFNANADVNLKIKNSFIKPDLYGDITITDAYIFEPIKSAPSGATIKINYNKDVLNLDVHVPTNINQYVDVKGPIFLYKNNSTDLHITSTDRIDLALAERLLDPIHRTFNFLLGPVPIMGFRGYGQIDLTVKGTRKDPHTFGWFKTNNATVSFDDIKNFELNNGNALLTFNDTNTEFELKSGTVNNKPINIKGTCSLEGLFNFDAKLNNQQLNDLLITLKTSPMLNEIAKSANLIHKTTGLADFSLNIAGKLLDINDLDFGKNMHAKGEINLKSNNIEITGQKLPIIGVTGKLLFNDTNINLDLYSSITAHSKIYLKGTLTNNLANITFKTDLIRIYDLLKAVKIPNIYISGKREDDLSTAAIEGKYNGNISNIDISKISTKGKIQLKNTNLIYAKNKIPIQINAGTININNSELILNKNILKIGTMPAIIDGRIRNIFSKNPILDIYLSSKPNQKFFDYMFNKNSVYPIKAKGDITCITTFKGELNKLNSTIKLHLNKDSSLYYMGSAIGDSNNRIHLDFQGIIEPHALRIKMFNYDKMILSQRGKLSPSRQLSMNGAIYYNKEPYFKNLKIKTAMPTDMRIFNIIFKKPLIKGGYFTSDIEINGNAFNPKILGQINTTGMNIPFFDTTIKSINMQFMPKEIIGKLNGDVLSNNFIIELNANNSFTPPYVVNTAKIETKNLNVNTILETLNQYEVEAVKSATTTSKTNSDNVYKFDINNLIIKKLQIIANTVLINKIQAHNLNTEMSIKNGTMKVDRFNFLLAQGTMNGSVDYNMHSQKSNFNLNVSNADANALLTSLFDVNGQIYGDIDGNLYLSCTGGIQEACIKTLNGNANFIVKNGRMPKLGSLEYLLKAGNLVKSGITGLSINGIVDLATPLKTGSFESIKGAIKFNNGIADNIQILSSGKDLSLYIIGDYNLVNYNANMYVFGKLSRKISTVLGPLGNLSLNTLFNTIPGVDLNDTSNAKLVNEINKIPGLELSNKAFRIFAAEIHGDINGEDYVQSFRWVE